MLKSKPKDDRFSDHIISQTGIHTPKSGVLFRQVLASGLPQSDRFSNHSYELPVHIEVLSRLTPFPPVSSPIPSEKNKQTCKMTQMAKCRNGIQTFLLLRRCVPAIIGPSSRELPIIQSILEITMLC